MGRLQQLRYSVWGSVSRQRPRIGWGLTIACAMRGLCLSLPVRLTSSAMLRGVRTMYTSAFAVRPTLFFQPVPGTTVQSTTRTLMGAFPGRRTLSTEAAVNEAVIKEKIEAALQPAEVVVEDVSGGCGAFFKVSVRSSNFQGKSIPEQHR